MKPGTDKPIPRPRQLERENENGMTPASRRCAGILLVIFPSVMIGGISLLSLLLWDREYAANSLRQDLWRAGHAHAGVWLILSLVLLGYVDQAKLSEGTKRLVRWSTPVAAIITPAAFFCSVLSSKAREPNSLIYLAYLGGIILGIGLITLGVGLLRDKTTD